MRRFVTLSILLLSSIPFGVSISGCSHTSAPVFCNGGDSGMTTGQVSTITMTPILTGISLNYAEIGQLNTPSATDCKGGGAFVQSYTYGTTDMTIADVQPTSGRLCAGTWNRNSGGGIPDYTYCNATNKSGTAYISASAEGVTSNPIAIYVHPVVTSVVLGGATPGPCSTDPTTLCALDSTQANGCSVQNDITAFSIANSVITFQVPNSLTAGASVTISGLSVGTYLNGQTLTVLSAGLSLTQFEAAFTHANVATTADSGVVTIAGTTTIPVYTGTSCLSQGKTAQLVSRIYAGSTNISCLAGHMQYGVQGETSTTTVSSVVSIDQNGVATAGQPGSLVITANVANAASSAGFFSTCPPATITLSAPGTTTSPAVIDVNNTQPLSATVTDINGVTLTGLSLEYVSTAPTTIPAAATGTVTPTYAGSGSITAICQPSGCNSAPYNQIGLFGNGVPVISNSVKFTTPGINSTVLYMASTESKSVAQVDFTTGVVGAPFQLPYVPNSMVMTNDGFTIFMGSSSGLMVLSSASSLSLSRSDTTSPGTVLAVSPDGNTIVLSDPVKQITTLESASGTVIATYGGVGTRAQFTPDSEAVYITAGEQLLVYNSYTGWTNITPQSPSPATLTYPVTDVAITVPSVGAYFASRALNTHTTARSYCPVSTPTSRNGIIAESNVFYPLADDVPTIADRIAATNDGQHIIGVTATATPPTLSDIQVNIPTGACPSTGVLSFTRSFFTTNLNPVTPTAITGVIPASDSSIAFVTYTGSGGFLPAYAPATSVLGTTTYIKLSGTATAPVAGVLSTDNSTLYVGTSGDNLVHLINRSTLTDSSTMLAPNLVVDPSFVSPTLPAGSIVPVNLMVQKPRKTT